ncbi:MAG: hypothetical protein HFH11_01715 [Dorea sp.]|jgi:uncharacterized secreted protein with C-terminal beta-propeller domain|nr:hypothetical protein [Dorea sp.]
MNKKEQEFINQIKKESETVNIPKSLEPEEMEAALKSRPKKFVWKKAHTIAAAACCLLACGIAYGMTKDAEHAGKRGAAGGAGADAKELRNSGVETVDDYEEVYEYLQAYAMNASSYDEDGGGAMITEDSAADMAAGGAETKQQIASETQKMDAAVPEAASAEYSETNVRQEGVDEADVVKTDGRYLYTLRDNGRAVVIVDTKDGLKEAAEVKLEDPHSIREFYVNNGKLALVGESYREEKTKSGWYMSTASTFAVTYDLSDPAKPEKIGEVTQSGYYTSSRMSEGHLYLFSQYSVDTASGIEPRDTEKYIPLVDGTLLPGNDIYLPTTKQAYMYAVISSVDMVKPDETKDSKAIFTDGGNLYVSNKNIYWYEDRSWYTGDTVIRRLSYQDGKLKAEASGMVGGYIHDSFCIDEYKGYLRVITTEKETNSVYVLDEKLKTVGSIEGLAEDERVYSARLMGDVGYFVTFRETDPLFSVDFSDPKKPEIIGELKIPGFSEYLHFYGEDMLLGIGMDVDEDGFTTNGVKLSMFDISDNTDVKEVQKYVMKNVYSADVMYDYRAALIDVGKNIIGFSANSGDGESYYVFSYDKGKGFACLMEETINGTGYQTARGVYIDQVLYVVKGNIIEAYGMEDYKKVGDIIL